MFHMPTSSAMMTTMLGFLSDVWPCAGKQAARTSRAGRNTRYPGLDMLFLLIPLLVDTNFMAATLLLLSGFSS